MRDYDPTTGRYLQADPLGLVDGASVYVYARGNPMKNIDIRGERVVVMCRPIASGLVRAFTFDNYSRHCAIFIVDSRCVCPADEDGINHQFSLPGEGTGFDDPRNPSDVYKSDRSYYLGSSSGANFFEIQVPRGMTECEFDVRVLISGILYNSPTGGYDPDDGPNSNSAVDDTIEDADGIMPDTGAAAQNYGEHPRDLPSLDSGP